MKLSVGILFSLLLFVNNSCEKNSEIVVSQYSNLDNWLNMPSPTKAIDVFYVYPTAWYRKPGYDSLTCPIDFPMMRIGARDVYARTATAFETIGNVFAPFYSQFDAQYILSVTEEERWIAIKNTPAKDVTEAFDYFIKNLNNGRPFILAGHSQGSMTLRILLSEYMKQNPKVYKRMIAAYVIGYPVTPQYLSQNPHLKFAKGADDTGVIISYNVQSPNLAPGSNSVVANNVGLVINPITWTTDETLATTSQGLGSYMPNPKEFAKIDQYADAKIDKAQGVLICSTADEDAMHILSSGFAKGNYHSFDYPFYYFNIRKNAEDRANKFLIK